MDIFLQQKPSVPSPLLSEYALSEFAPGSDSDLIWRKPVSWLILGSPLTRLSSWVDIENRLIDNVD